MFCLSVFAFILFCMEFSTPTTVWTHFPHFQILFSILQILREVIHNALDVCVSPPHPPNLYVETNAQCDGMRWWSLGRCLGHEDRALINKISALIKETLETKLSPSTMWWLGEKVATYEPGNGFPSDTESRQSLCHHLGFPSLWNYGKWMFIVYKPLILWYFVLAAQTDEVSIFLLHSLKPS